MFLRIMSMLSEVLLALVLLYFFYDWMCKTIFKEHTIGKVKESRFKFNFLRKEAKNLEDVPFSKVKKAKDKINDYVDKGESL